MERVVMSDMERSEPDSRLAARVAVMRCGQSPSFKSGKDLPLLSCSLDSWLQDAGKDYWQVERHPKIIAAPDLFRKSWNKNTPARLYVDECNRL
jgi:hypothetical protein